MTISATFEDILSGIGWDTGVMKVGVTTGKRNPLTNLQWYFSFLIIAITTLLTIGVDVAQQVEQVSY